MDRPIQTSVRGFGIYRQVGDRFFANFQLAQEFADFAQGAYCLFNSILGCPFQDHNLISGQVLNNGQQILVDQLAPEEGACGLR